MWIFLGVVGLIGAGVAIGLGYLAKRFAANRPVLRMLVSLAILAGLLLWFTYDAGSYHTDELVPGVLTWAGGMLVVLSLAVLVSRWHRIGAWAVGIAGAWLAIDSAIRVTLSIYSAYSPDYKFVLAERDPAATPWLFFQLLTQTDRFPWYISDFFWMYPYLYLIFSVWALAASLGLGLSRPRPQAQAGVASASASAKSGV